MMFDFIEKITNTDTFVAFLVISVFLVSSAIFEEIARLLFWRLGIREQYQFPLIETIRNLFCSIVTGLMICACLAEDEQSFLSDMLSRVQNEFTKCEEYGNTIKVKAGHIYILHTIYALGEIQYTLNNKGFMNLDFFESLTFFATFISALGRCPMFGVLLLLLTNLSKIPELISKLLYILGDYFNSTNLQVLSISACVISILTWVHTFIYVCPLVFAQHQHTYKGANISLLIMVLYEMYHLLNIVNSVFTRVVVSVTMPSPQSPKTMEFYLLGFNSD